MDERDKVAETVARLRAYDADWPTRFAGKTLTDEAADLLEAAESALARLRADQEAMVGAVRQKIGAGAFDLYSLRHTTASELLAAGCSDEEIAAVLGHKSSRTVPIYTATVRQMSRARDAMEKRK